MRTIETIKKYVSAVSRVTAILTYFSFAAIILLTVVDVVLRKTINKPIVGGYEIITYLILVGVFSSFAYCQTLKGHIQVTMILRLLPRKAVFVINTITSLLTTIVMGFVAYAAAQQAIYIMERGFLSDTLKFPTHPFIWLECVCMAIFTLVCFVDLLESAAAIGNTELQDKIMEHWN